ncbi:MAG: hypothetical protein WA941_13050 [Nitrososphaeraceae archaeon]
MTNSSNKKKPKIDHIIKTGVNEKGEFSKTQKLVLKTADKVFNSPGRAAGTKKKDSSRRQK